MRAASVRAVARPLGRIALGLGSLLIVCSLTFLALDLLPGDAATQRFGLQASLDAVASARRAGGLDDPPLLRLGSWLLGVPRGDLGTVLSSGRPVADALAAPLERSLVLLAISAACTLVLGIGGGILTALHRGRLLDRLAGSAALTIVCMPEFIVGTLLVLLFAGLLGWLPAVSVVSAGGDVLGDPAVLALPVAAAVLVASAPLLRRTRAVVLEQVARPHVEAAELAGTAPGIVVLRHLLPGAAGPLAQAFAATVPVLVGGTVVLEQLFGFPGLGSALVDSVRTREEAVVMACVSVLSALTIGALAAADLLAGRPT